MQYIKSTLLISICILTSKILGYIRDTIVAYKIGASIVNDIFIISFKLINLLRNLAENVLNIIFIPVLSRKTKRDNKDSILKFLSITHGIIIGIISIICFIIITLIPKIIWNSTIGFREKKEILKIFISFNRILSPYLFCILIASFYGCILNSFNNFFPFAFAPVIFNISNIIFLWILKNISNTKHILVTTTLLSSVIELIWMLYFIKYNKLKLKFLKYNFKIHKIFERIIIVVLSNLYIHFYIWINIIILSFFTGSTSFIYYSERIIYLPVSIIGNAINNVLITLFSKVKKVFSIQEYAINLVVILGNISIYIIYVFSQEIIFFLFEKGNFNNLNTKNTSIILRISTYIIPPIILTKILNVKLYSKMNVILPYTIIVITTSINISINLILIYHYKYLAINISNIISIWLNLLILKIKNNILFSTFIYIEITKYVISTLLTSLFVLSKKIKLKYSLNTKIIYIMIIKIIIYYIVCYAYNIFVFRKFKSKFN